MAESIRPTTSMPMPTPTFAGSTEPFIHLAVKAVLLSQRAFFLVIVLISLAVAAGTVHHLRKKYLAFLALGPGGTPSTIGGFIRVQVLGLFALRDVYSPRGSVQKSRSYPERRIVTENEEADEFPSEHGAEVLSQLPTRLGSRPRTYGIAPHRQIDQRVATSEAFSGIVIAMQEIAASYPGLVTLGSSCFEPHTVGLFFCSSQMAMKGQREGKKSGSASASAGVKHCGTEIAHAHPSDASLHVVLRNPCDADAVLLARWGERHPLARGGWWERFVPEGFVMVYAPRSIEEIRVVKNIVEGAVWGFLREMDGDVKG